MHIIRRYKFDQLVSHICFNTYHLFVSHRVDQLLDSNTGRMESLKAQQLNFGQRLDSFEHIQRLTRHTLDELKGETDKYLGSRVARQLSQKQKNRDKLRGKKQHRIEFPLPFD